MEAINFERKQLLQQWKSALIGMQRRDEALQATEGALLKQREQEMALESEISGVKKLIRKEEERNEVLVSTESKLEAEERGVTPTSRPAPRRRSAPRALRDAQQIARADGRGAGQAADDARALAHAVPLLDTNKVDTTTFSTLSERIAVEEGTANTLARTEKLKHQREEKGQQQATMQNELTHPRRLAQRAHNSELDAQLNTINAELADKDALSRATNGRGGAPRDREEAARARPAQQEVRPLMKRARASPTSTRTRGRWRRRSST